MSILPKHLTFFLIAIICFATGNMAFSAEGGYSNYVPGAYGDFGMALGPTERWTIRNDLYFYQADSSLVVRNGALEVNGKVDSTANLTTLLYNPKATLFGGQYAIGAVLPIVNTSLDASVQLGNELLSVSGDRTGLGDIAIMPIMLFWQNGNLFFSFTESIVTPTGDFNVNETINAGLNYWSFDTNFAANYVNQNTGQDYSINIGHIYNTENDKTNYQSGQEIHIDIALNQFLTENLAIGLQGFYLNQITSDKGEGALLGEFRAKAMGWGPMIMWSKKLGSQNFSFFAKWINETDVENRLKGDHFFLSFAFDW